MNGSRTLNSRFRFQMCFAMILLAGGIWATPVSAQPQDAPLQRPRMDTSLPNTPAPGGVIQAQGGQFYLQGAVVVLLCGGAVWTVCRSSRRQ